MRGSCFYGAGLRGEDAFPRGRCLLSGSRGSITRRGSGSTVVSGRMKVLLRLRVRCHGDLIAEGENELLVEVFSPEERRRTPEDHRRRVGPLGRYGPGHKPGGIFREVTLVLVEGFASVLCGQDVSRTGRRT